MVPFLLRGFEHPYPKMFCVLLLPADDFGDDFGLTAEQLLEIQEEADIGKLNDKGGVSLVQERGSLLRVTCPRTGLLVHEQAVAGSGQAVIGRGSSARREQLALTTWEGVIRRSSRLWVCRRPIPLLKKAFCF